MTQKPKKLNIRKELEKTRSRNIAAQFDKDPKYFTVPWFFRMLNGMVLILLVGRESGGWTTLAIFLLLVQPEIQALINRRNNIALKKIAILIKEYNYRIGDNEEDLARHEEVQKQQAKLISNIVDIAQGNLNETTQI
jgi:hypothetical protein